MKYRIVYPTGFSDSACYLIGHDKDGKPIYRKRTTTPPKVYTAREKAEMRAALASVLGQFY
jgi:hypothetical protein